VSSFRAPRPPRPPNRPTTDTRMLAHENTRVKASMVQKTAHSTLTPCCVACSYVTSGPGCTVGRGVGATVGDMIGGSTCECPSGTSSRKAQTGSSMATRAASDGGRGCRGRTAASELVEPEQQSALQSQAAEQQRPEQQTRMKLTFWLTGRVRNRSPRGTEQVTTATEELSKPAADVPAGAGWAI